MYIEHQPLLPEQRSLMEKSSKNQRKRLRRKIMWERQGEKCFWCNRKTDLPDNVNNNSRRKATFDHLRPRSRGGMSNLGNLVIACASCNQMRSNKTFQQTVKWLKSNTKNWRLKNDVSAVKPNL